MRWIISVFSALSMASASQGADLVTHNSVLIQAPAEKIWPHIVDPNEWKAGAHLLPADEKGQVFKAVMPDRPDQALFTVVNVESVENQRRTIRLSALDGALMGYATWHLEDVNDATLVTYDVYSYFAELPEGVTEAAWVKESEERYQAELEALRRMVQGD